MNESGTLNLPVYGTCRKTYITSNTLIKLCYQNMYKSSHFSSGRSISTNLRFTSNYILYLIFFIFIHFERSYHMSSRTTDQQITCPINFWAGTWPGGKHYLQGMTWVGASRTSLFSGHMTWLRHWFEHLWKVYFFGHHFSQLFGKLHLLWNHWAKCNQTWQGWSLGRGD